MQVREHRRLEVGREEVGKGGNWDGEERTSDPGEKTDLAAVAHTEA